MTTKKITAKFIGSIGGKSLGFENGQRYVLEVAHKEAQMEGSYIQVNGYLDIHTSIKINYSTIIAFLNNWDEISISKN